MATIFSIDENKRRACFVIVRGDFFAVKKTRKSVSLPRFGEFEGRVAQPGRILVLSADGQPHAEFVVDGHGGLGVSGTGSAVSGS